MKSYPTMALLSLAAAALFTAAPGAKAADKLPICPIMKVQVQHPDRAPGYVVDGKKIPLCCNDCNKAFVANPETFIDAEKDLGSCPVSHHPDKKTAATRVVINNQLQYTCCGGCPQAIAADPAKYFKTLTDVVSKKEFAVSKDSPRSNYRGQVYVFAGKESKEQFDHTPTRFAVVFGGAKAK